MSNKDTDEINRKLAPVLEDIATTIYGNDNKGTVGLKIAHVSDKYPGWHDGIIGSYYFTIFDLNFKAAQELKDLFDHSVLDIDTYHFKPTPSFDIKGILRKKGTKDNVAYAILYTNVNSSYTDSRGITTTVFPFEQP
jgi:hypothetical protein